MKYLEGEDEQVVCLWMREKTEGEIKGSERKK